MCWEIEASCSGTSVDKLESWSIVSMSTYPPLSLPASSSSERHSSCDKHRYIRLHPSWHPPHRDPNNSILKTIKNSRHFSMIHEQFTQSYVNVPRCSRLTWQTLENLQVSYFLHLWVQGVSHKDGDDIPCSHHLAVLECCTGHQNIYINILR